MASASPATDVPNDFATNLARYRASRAHILGCAEAAFATNALTIVERPRAAPEPFVALAVTFGTGTVVSVEQRYIDVVRGFAIEPHNRAFFPPALIDPLIAHAREQGESLAYRPPNLGFLCASLPPAPELPPGVHAVDIDRDWRTKWLDSGTFDNALGDVESAYVDTIWERGIAIVDGDGAPLAVAGMYRDRDEFREIGVDVQRGQRSGGLGRAVVALAARSIVDEGLVPTYYCAPTNVRSHRTAISCGFLPAVSMACVSAGR